MATQACENIVGVCPYPPNCRVRCIVAATQDGVESYREFYRGPEPAPEYGIEERLVRSLGWALQFVKPRTDAEREMLAAARRTWFEGIEHFVEAWVPEGERP